MVTVNNSLVHIGDKTKKDAHTVLETAEGQDVSEHNTLTQAHIIVNPRKTRAPKVSAKKKNAPVKAAHKAAFKKQEEKTDESADYI